MPPQHPGAGVLLLSFSRQRHVRRLQWPRVQRERAHTAHDGRDLEKSEISRRSFKVSYFQWEIGSGFQCGMGNDKIPDSVFKLGAGLQVFRAHHVDQIERLQPQIGLGHMRD